MANAHDDSFRDRAVVVTGGSGFIGSHLVRRLAQAGSSVHVLLRERNDAPRLAAVDSRIKLWRGDVTDYASVLECCRSVRPEAVVHLAADTTVRRGASWDAVLRSVHVNLTGTLHVLRATAESGGRPAVFVRAGGLEEYGTADVPFDEALRERPSSPYSASQVAATHYAQMLQRHVDFAIVTLRPALVYGPGQSSDFLIPSLISSCLRGEPFAMSDGEQHREFVYIDDVIDAFMAAMTRPNLEGTIMNIGPGVEHRIRDVAKAIVEIIGTPDLLRLGAQPGRSSDLVHLVAKNQRAKALLGWRATVDLHEGLERTIAWHRASAAAR